MLHDEIAWLLLIFHQSRYYRSPEVLLGYQYPLMLMSRHTFSCVFPLSQEGCLVWYSWVRWALISMLSFLLIYGINPSRFYLWMWNFLPLNQARQHCFPTSYSGLRINFTHIWVINLILVKVSIFSSNAHLASYVVIYNSCHIWYMVNVCMKSEMII